MKLQCVGIGLVVALVGCQMGDVDTGEIDQDALVGGSLANRWYGSPGHLNLVTYFVGALGTPYDLPASYATETRLAAGYYNDHTALDFEEFTGSATALKNDPNPHVLYIRVSTSGWTSNTIPFSKIVTNANDSTNANQADWKSILATYGASGLGVLRGASGSRHDDYLVTYRSGLSFDGTTNTLHVPIHETGHVLGLSHEQNRPDRCTAMEVFDDCIEDKLLSQFDESTTAKVLSPYDILSVMQYGSEFGCNEASGGGCICKTMLARFPTSGSPITQSEANECTGHGGTGYEIAQTNVLSNEDVNVMFQLYPPALGSDEANDKLGTATVAGDFDGDGYTDLAVGGPGQDLGSLGHTGVVFLYKGTFTGLEPWGVIDEPGTNRADGDGFGSALAVIPGSRARLVVGAPGRTVDGAHRGAVYVIDVTGPKPNTTSTLITAQTAGFTESAPGDGFGTTLVTGDFDGDNHTDIAIGVPGAHFVYVVDGASGWSSQSKWGVDRSVSDNFGIALAAGSLARNGFDDLVIGSSQTNTSSGGRIYVARGSASGLSGIIAVDEPSPVASDRFGAAVAVIALDGSTGGRSIVAGAPGRHGNQGSIFVFGANSLGTPVERTGADFGLSAPVGFGRRLVAGHLSSSGNEDLVVGIPAITVQGTVEAGLHAVYLGITSGNSRLQPQTTTFHAGVPQTNEHYGDALAIGDFDHDGVGDLAVGAPNRNSAAGEVWVFHGRQGQQPLFPADESTFTGHLLQALQLIYRR